MSSGIYNFILHIIYLNFKLKINKNDSYFICNMPYIVSKINENQNVL